MLQTIAAGMSNGAVYGLAALGIVAVFRVARVINLAQGEAITIGALGTWWLDVHGWPRAPAALAVVAATAAYFGVMARLAVLRAGRATSDETLGVSLVTLGLALFTQGVLFVAFGRELHGSPPVLNVAPFMVAGVPLPPHTILMLGTTAGFGLALAGMLRWTMAGRAMVACSENRFGAAVVGVDVRRTMVRVFAGAGALGALAGVLLAPVTVFSYLTGFAVGLRGLAAAALVGFRSGSAGLAAGVVVGVLEAVVSTYVSSGYQEPFVAVVLIGALVAWPRLAPASEAT